MVDNCIVAKHCQLCRNPPVNILHPSSRLTGFTVSNIVVIFVNLAENSAGFSLLSRFWAPLWYFHFLSVSAVPMLSLSCIDLNFPPNVLIGPKIPDVSNKENYGPVKFLFYFKYLFYFYVQNTDNIMTLRYIELLVSSGW